MNPLASWLPHGALLQGVRLVTIYNYWAMSEEGG